MTAGRNPKDIKLLLVKIVSRFHGGQQEKGWSIETRFKQGKLPDEMPEIKMELVEGKNSLFQIIKAAGLTSSSSEALRAISQGGVRWDGNKITDKALLMSPGNYILQVGKRRFAKVLLT